ncbi:MAG: response regulator transcription factor [Deltaproteobacteria bacterium]|nr:response regulator transcription factor [Deltaproteobacteria bacterium]
MMSQGTIHVVDDDTAVERGLRWLFESAEFAVETYQSAEDFAARYQRAAGPECLVLDLCMPGMSGLALHRTFDERSWALPVIYLTGHGKVPDAVAALRQGAFDFVEKPCADDALLVRVRAALTEDARRRARAEERALLSARIASLTTREHQVAMRVAAGLPNKRIAAELGISPRTVEVYRAKAMSKTGSRSMADLVQLVMRERGDGVAAVRATPRAP